MTKMYVWQSPVLNGRVRVCAALFEKHGAVQSVALINDRDTGRPRFGFVEMASADAARAMQGLNGHDVDGRALKVNELRSAPAVVAVVVVVVDRAVRKRW